MKEIRWVTKNISNSHPLGWLLLIFKPLPLMQEKSLKVITLVTFELYLRQTN